MSDPIQEKPKGMFQDPQGDFSSGRFIKITSLFMAAILSGILAYGFIFEFTKEKPSDPSIVSSIAWTIGAFLGVAAGAELVQKITKT
jgi:uncharacterized membrane protein YfcA